MTPPHQSRRFGLIIAFGVLLLGGVFLLLSALKDNTQFFYNPSDVMDKGFLPSSQIFNTGGLVVDSSVIRDDNLTTIFKVKDFEREMIVPITVSYTGVLPDLFREGQGVVITGQMVGDASFLADKVLAKHDENYQPDIKYQSEK